MNENDMREGYEGVGEYYDLFVSNDDIPFYLDFAKKQGSPILDVAAGACRVSIALAWEGFEVFAIEKSPSMLSAAWKKLTELPKEVSKRVHLVEGDMTSFDLKREFSLIIIPASFGHAFTTEEQLSTLRCIKMHLASKGLFILDLYPGALQNQGATFEDTPISLPDGRIIKRKGSLRTDFFDQIMRLNLQYRVEHPDGREETVEVTSGAAIIFDREANLLLQHVGLCVEKEFGGFRYQPYSRDAARRVLILKKC